MGYKQTEGSMGTWHARNRRWPRIPEERRREITDIPFRFRGYVLEDLPTTAAGRTVRRWCERWGEYPSSGLPLDDYDNNRGRGLWLHGTPGTGKTTMACIVANHLSDLGWSTKFTTVANLYDLSLWPMSAETEEQRAEWELLYDCYDAGWDGWRCVVLDDFGKEHKTKSRWSQDLLDSLIRDRFNSAAPTIVTTNLRVDQLGNAYNASLQDFINEAFFVVEVTGESHRGR